MVADAAAAVEQRRPFHFGDEQRLHEGARPVQTVERPELGLMSAERLTTAAAGPIAAVGGHRFASVIVTAAAAAVVVANSVVTAASVQVAERRGRATAQVAGHAPVLLRLARQRRHRWPLMLLLLVTLFVDRRRRSRYGSRAHTVLICRPSVRPSVGIVCDYHHQPRPPPFGLTANTAAFFDYYSQREHVGNNNCIYICYIRGVYDFELLFVFVLVITITFSVR